MMINKQYLYSRTLSKVSKNVFLKIPIEIELIIMHVLYKYFIK